MQPIRIVTIGNKFNVTTKHGKKEKIVILARDGVGNTFEATMWMPKSGTLPFNEGEEVLAQVEKNGEYINIEKVEKFDTPFPPVPKEVKDTTVQDIPKDTAPKAITKNDDMEKWLLYFDRLNQILDLFKGKECQAETPLAGAILGLREMMFGNTKK